jgi:hypothetical protein
VVELIAACQTGSEGDFESESITYKATFWLPDPALKTRILAIEQKIFLNEHSNRLVAEKYCRLRASGSPSTDWSNERVEYLSWGLRFSESLFLTFVDVHFFLFMVCAHLIVFAAGRCFSRVGNLAAGSLVQETVRLLDEVRT